MDTQQLQFRIEKLEEQMRDHFHSGNGDRQVNLLNIFGKFDVVSTAPVGVPQSISGQIKLYSNGATYRLYAYDSIGGAWHYVDLT